VVAFVGIYFAARLNDLVADGGSFRLGHNERSAASRPLPHDDDALPLAGPVREPATIGASWAAISGANVSTEVGTVNLNVAPQFVALLVGLQHLTELLKPDECRFVVDLKLLSQANGGKALQLIYEVGHHQKQIAERQFPTGKDRLRCSRELATTRLRGAFPLSTCRNRIDFAVSAPRAIRFTAIIAKANGYEFSKCLFLGQPRNPLRTKRSRLWR
jgi:hypothetical protein